MTDSELRKYRKQLMELGRRISGHITSLSGEALRGGGDAAGNLSKLPLHLADVGSDSYDQALALSLLENDNQLAEDIKAAVDRIDQGTFGPCEECQKEIDHERLQAVPFTRYCIDCARRLEEEGVIGRNTTLP